MGWSGISPVPFAGVEWIILVHFQDVAKHPRRGLC